ncbi:MAG: spermidine synthase [Myxococcota bacterium]
MLGDSVTQFSLVIGAYLFAMGIGSYLSRFVDKDLLAWFIRLELAVGLIGGFSALMLFVTFARDGAFRLVLYLTVGGVGIGVGLEIPLLIRILENRMKLRDLVARVLFFDYLGALIASVAFPLFLVPKLGLIKTSLLLGIVNAFVGIWIVFLFAKDLRSPRRLALEAMVCIILLGGGLAYGEELTQMVEDDLFPHEIVQARTSRYQRIVVTKSPGGEVRLYLNNHLQFSSLDEYRYHEALTHPPLAVAPPGPLQVLVLGGGDGMAVRELLRSPDVEAVTLVDLDPEMTEIFTTHSDLTALNGDALNSEKVTVVNDDAMAWLENDNHTFDVVLIDFPDPSSYSVGKLYTRTFYAMVGAHLKPGGVVSVQSTSPLVARQSFWCIDATMRDVGFKTRPYHVLVPSFGEWGFVLASLDPFPLPARLRAGIDDYRFLTNATLPTLFQFPADMARVEAPVNRLNQQHLVRLYDEEWNAIH